MSKQVDERVVTMEFDNSRFEKNVSTTLSTLDKLKRSLNLSGAAKGLSNISAEANKVNMSGLSKAVDTIHQRFSALEVVAVTALMNITNSAINAGKRIVSALTLDPVMTGFREYETQINAIQTILANTKSKGTTIDQVNAALDELNKYADQTIYNFTEMTRNIGTFTAAGVDLEKSVTSIKGIANLAAVSGSNAQQAATAMYQLSQALAAGRVSLMDWNSVVNAGMGGELFQNALKRTAENFGTNVDAMIAKYGSFRESLTQGGWLTAEVLTETLTQLSGAYSEADLIAQGYTEQQAKEIVELAETAVNAATKVKTFTQLWDTLKESVQSGWSQSWEIIIGNFEEAQELLTGVSDALTGFVTKSAEARNKVLQEWKDLGGRDDLVAGFKNAFEGIASIIKPISEAFREIFPATTGKRLAEITKGFKELTANLKISDETAKNIKNTFKGVFSVISLGIDIFTSLAKGAAEIAGSLLGLGSGLTSVTGMIGDFISGLTQSVKEANIFSTTIDGIVTVITSIIDVVANVGNNIFSGIGLVIDRLGSQTISGITEISKALSDALQNGSIENVMEVVQSGIFASLLMSIKNVVDGFKKDTSTLSSITEMIGSVFDNLAGILDTARESLEAWQQNLKAGTLLKIAGAVGILAGSLAVISSIDKERLSDSLGALTVLFSEVLGAMPILNKLSANFLGNAGLTTTLIGMSSAILILSSALKKVSGINPEQLTSSLMGIAGLATIMVATSKALSAGVGPIQKGASNLIIFSAAISVLASACKDMSTLEWDELGKGLLGVGGLMAEVSIFLSATKIKGNVIGTAAGILVLSGAIKVIASACKDFAKMEVDGIIKSLSAIGGIFIEMSAFNKLSGDSKNMLSLSVSLGIMAYSLKVFAEVFNSVKNISWESIGKGLVTIGSGLTIISVAARSMPSNNLLQTSIAFPIMASSLLILADAMKQISGLSWEDVGKGIVSISASMIVLVKALNSTKNVGGAAVSMTVAAAAITLIASSLVELSSMGLTGMIASIGSLAGVFVTLGVASSLLKPLIPTLYSLSGGIATLGLSFISLGAGTAVIGAGMLSLITSLVAAIMMLQNISWNDISKGMLAMAGMFAVIGVSAVLLKGLTPTILSLSASITLLGVSCAAIAGSIYLLTAGLNGLAGVTKDGAKAIVTALEEILVGLTGILPKVIPNMTDTIKALFLGILDVVTSCAPQFAESLLKMVTEVLKSLTEYGPQITDFILKFIIDIINTVADRMPEIVTAITNLLGSLFTSVMSVLSTIDTKSLLEAVGAVGLMAVFTKSLSTVTMLIPKAMIGVVGMGVLIAELSVVLAAIGGLAQIPGLEWLISEGGNLLESVGTALGKFVGGIAGGLLSGVSSSFPKLGTNLSKFMKNITPFIDGAKNIDGSTASGVASLAKAILLITAADVINGLTSWLTGGNSMEKFGEQLVPFGKSLKEYSDAVTGISPETITASATAAKSLSELANNLPNSGGLVAWFTGNNNIDDFGKMLKPFGEGMKGYYDAINGIQPDAIVASATAAKSLSELANNLPNSGGLAAWFAGDNKIDEFGEQIVVFGESLKSYSDAVYGITPDTITASATAAKSLMELANNLPNSGGIISWFTGDNDIGSFGVKLVAFGEGLKSYSNSINGIEPDTITASATAAKSLSELANNLPDSGGLISWFVGDNDIATFGSKLPVFGAGLKAYSDSVAGINAESISASGQAAKALAEISNVIPETGGLISFFAGDQNMSAFGEQLPAFGEGLKSYAVSVSGIAEYIDSINASATAVNALASLSNSLPSVGGIVSYFTGEQSLEAFGEQLPAFGEAVKSYATSVTDITPESIAGSVSAVESLANLANSLPQIGGIVEFFTGEQSLEEFGSQLPAFGEAMKNYAVAVKELKVEDIQNSVSAAQSLVEIANKIQNSGGAITFFTGDNGLDQFGFQIVVFGEALQKYSKVVNDVKSDKIIASAEGAKALADVASKLQNSGGAIAFFTGDNGLDQFGFQMIAFGEALKSYSVAVTDVKPDKVTASATAISSLVDVFKNMNGINIENVESFKNAVTALGKLDISTLTNSFSGSSEQLKTIGSNISSFITQGIKGSQSKVTTAVSEIIQSMISKIKEKNESFKSAGKTLIDKLNSGITENKDNAKGKIESMLKSLVSTIKGYKSQFYSAGKHLVTGFANGISDNTYLAKAKSKAMAKAAANAAKEELDEHSPSKVGYGIGDFFGVAFVNGISDRIKDARDVSVEMAKSARTGLSSINDTLSRIINSDLDVQPVITPVVDLSKARSRLSELNNMFGINPSLSMLSTVGSINTSINRRNQNGVNDEVVSAIKDLKKSMSNLQGDQYNINGITYDDGSNVAEAVQTIIRAARVERRK